TNSQQRSSPHPRAKVPPSKRRTTPTAWQKPTGPFHISDSDYHPINGKRLKIYKEYWYCGPHRCGQDDDYGAHPVLRRTYPQDRGSARRRRDDGLDGTGTGTWYHHHIGCYDCLLELSRTKISRQHYRHAG